VFRPRKMTNQRQDRPKPPRQVAFEALMSAYGADVYRYALWLVRNRAQAEDLVQETFLRAWKSIDSLRDPKAAKSWLITILRRERARLYEREQPQTDALDDLDLDTMEGFDPGYGKSEHVALRRALAGLAEEYREPLLLQVVGGYSCDEIGELLGIAPGAVMTRLSRARQRLAQTLTGDVPPNAIQHTERAAA